MSLRLAMWSMAAVLIELLVIVGVELSGGGLSGSAGVTLKLLLAFCTAIVVICVLFIFLSLPFRRRERARMFLELIEEGARTGQVERFLVRVTEARDNSLGNRFQLLTTLLTKGISLDEALIKVPRLLPPDMVALLRVAREAGQFESIIPLCRERLRDAGIAAKLAQGRLILCGLLPVQFLICLMISTFVWPKFRQLGYDMEADIIGLERVMSYSMWIWPTVFLVFGVPVVLGMLHHIAGPRPLTLVILVFPKFGGWLINRFHGFSWMIDAVVLRFPWKRCRLERDFGRVLTQLLDLRLQEEKAVRLAAESTANLAFVSLAGRVIDALKTGMKLPDALGLLNKSGDLRWRLNTAAQSVHRWEGSLTAKSASGSAPLNHFQTSLAGWHSALDAKAFQGEQTATHIFNAAFIIANGVLVALTCCGTMQILVSLIAAAGEW